jgi:hypothetical protein
MVQEVVLYCLTTSSALVMNHSYGNAVTVDGMCMALGVPIFMMWVLIVTDVRHTVIDNGLEI